ncbi:small EDRK-rich factor 2 [Gloeophyllum trabeum ATCC 11539]|uniref:Small EDRK-rich factor 2 n=1 Tax=Gloeophyllum trabeum (strain ATCC 11539 / FP-39264 / Madison 617) TaxID=670483 RepID=S7QNS6_GLOTA|nr:small EDRK-rich factor 2 [Gloeophyllum trabeum ATCC 11539]EPQ61221.1 small EDRK-rich factor 2 [Gloeophyllum trabeum ATCC 11539]
MTRGDQRERDRQKAAKKLAEKNKGKPKDGLSVEKRKERDAEILRQKQQKALELKQNGGAGGGGGGK